MGKPLVSVILLSYKNYRYIYEALDSILQQDYPNIELIINNDGASDFDGVAVKKYLKTHKQKNIKRIVIRNNRENLGTVKSINNAIKIAKGEYINFFAADDVMYDQAVLSKFIASFATLPSKEYIVTSQLGMYDIDLKEQIQLFLNKTNIQVLQSATPLELFNKMATKCLVAAAGTCYKKQLFEKYGYFDERYRLVEDYSSALAFSRLGIKFNYFDFISFKHRDGGISHGNVNGVEKLNKLYDLDILNIMRYEILPFIHLLDKEQKRKFLELYRDTKWRFEYKYNFEHSTKQQRRRFIAKNWKLMVYGLYRDIKQYLVDQLVGRKFKAFLLGILLFLTSFFISDGLTMAYLGMHQYNLGQGLQLIGLFLIAEVVILMSYQIYRLLSSRLFRFIKFVN